MRVEGGYSINARKIFTSGAPAGDLLMTGAVLEEDGQEPMVLHFGIPMTSPHVRIDPVWRTLGMRGTGSHDVLIEGHVIPETAVALKRKAGEWHPLFHTIATLAFPLVYAAYLGVAESACSIAVELARKRRADHNVTQLIGRMQTELAGAQMAHRHMVEAASRGTTSAETVNDVMIGKRLVTEHGIRAVEFAMEAAGGAGFYRSQGLERRFRDIQGARYHVLQAGPQATFAGSLALGLPCRQGLLVGESRTGLDRVHSRPLPAANCGRAFRPERHGDEGPGGRRRRDQLARKRRGNLLLGKARGRGASERAQRVSGPRQNGERERFGNLQPVVPMVQVGETVGAHDPHEMCTLQHRRHPAQGLRSGARSQLLLDIRHDEARMARNPAGEVEAGAILSGFRRILQRILRRYQPPDPVQLQLLQRIERHHVVPVMRRIEGSAEEADSLSVAEGRKADQGRT